MELKGYQKKVIDDLETFVQLSAELHSTRKAFDQLWEDKLGSAYDPLTGKGMRPYQNNIPHAAHVCLKVPTAGGKTFLAVNALKTIFDSFPPELPKAVIWLVPWSNLLDQTVRNLSNPDHPYRQRLNALFNHRVQVYQKEELLQGASFSPASVREQVSILVMSFASLRARKKEDRKVYQENGQMAGFAGTYTSSGHVLENTDETALINVIRSLQPVVVLDESHNAESELSVDMLQNLNPSFVLDLTATPRSNSNILSIVPAIELKKEHMVKLPVIVYNLQQREQVIDSALHLQQQLEALARAQENKGGKYIRPIVLFQAQARTGDEKIDFKKLKDMLLTVGIPGERIKIKTAEIDELKGIDLMDRKCEVRYIITVNALKEGWDCPFAYILASLADKSSAVDVEQILGRVLRQPYVSQHSQPMLNLSYVLTASAKFSDTLGTIVKALQNSGFSEKDYRQKDAMPEADKEATRSAEIQQELFGNAPAGDSTGGELEIDTSELRFDPDAVVETPEAGLERTVRFAQEDAGTYSSGNATVDAIAELAWLENAAMEEQVKQQAAGNQGGATVAPEMADRVSSYKMVEAAKELVMPIVLPIFMIRVEPSMFSGDYYQKLGPELLLSGFRLNAQDSLIDLEAIKAEIVKVDLEQTVKDEYSPKYSRIENPMLRDEFARLFLAHPREGKIKDLTRLLFDQMGNLWPIADQDIKAYIGKILGQINELQVHEVFDNRVGYAKKIREKIKQHTDNYAEKKFGELLKLSMIQCVPTWSFPSEIVPGPLGPDLSKSLYQREGAINETEKRMIEQITALDNIAFWHRNPSRKPGAFSINGFKSDHYPDFILITRSGKVILLETKGEHLSNPENQSKCHLGNKWQELAGDRFKYFMVFERNPIDGAWTVEEAKRLIGML
ncbi:MAG: hypothetical protein RLZZ165_775 [Bacteroidota bacterium]